jgi:hypothetical protein
MHLTQTSKYLAALGLVLGSLAIVITFYTNIIDEMGEGRSLFGAIVHYFSFYTNWTNILLVLIYFDLFFGWTKLSSPVNCVTGLSSIIMVMIVYHMLLSATHSPQGIEVITNVVKHYITPVIFTLFWFTSRHIGALRWGDLYKFLFFPMTFLVFTYVKAAVTGEYPYDFLNYSLNGFSGVAPIIGGIVVLILLLGSLAILYDNKNPDAQ